jgi:predicted anti-sigma-YlaC factor YlaD
MSCRQVRRKLSAYQDKELPESQMNEIEHHLKSCAACSRLLQEMNDVWEVISHIETVKSAPYFWTRLSQRMKEKDIKSQGWNFVFAPIQKFSLTVLIPIILIIGFGIGMYLGENIYQHSNISSSVPIEQELDQVLSWSSFDDFPQESIGEVYVTLLSENNQ